MKRRFHRLAVLLSLLLLPGAAHAQTIDLAAGGADQVWIGPEANAAAGTWLDQGAVSNGDTRRDLIVGAPGTTGISGRVFVIFGGPVKTGTIDLSTADVVITGAGAGDGFGFTTAAGNIWNTEGSIPRALVVGAPNSGAGNAGKVYLFRGGFGGGETLTTADALLEIHGLPGDQLGSSLATADLNNDGYREIIMGAPGNNRVYVVNGAASLDHAGPATVLNLAVTPAAVTITGTAIGAVLSAGDVTGDGIYDIVLGAPNANVTYIVKGRSSGTFPAVWDLATTPADITLVGTTTGDRLGASLRILDIDGDTRRDLLLGAPGGDGPNESRIDSGEIYGLLGNTLSALAAIPSAVYHMSSANLRFYGEAAGHEAGTEFTAGDINRDFPNDLVLSAPGAGAAGEWQVYYGRTLSSIGAADPQGVRIVDLASPGQIDRRILADPAQGTAAAAQVFEVTGEGARDIIIGVPGAQSGAGAVYFTISPKMRLSDESVSVNLIVNAGQSFAYRVYVENSSVVPITWSTAASVPWLSTNPAAGSAVDGNDGTFYLIASAGTFAPGTYTGSVVVSSTSRDLQMSLTVSVTMQVAPATRDPGDFSGDGSFDIIWQHQTQGWLSVWKMNGATLQSGESLDPDRVADTDWKVVGTGDFNGDGHPDLLWHHRTQGWVSAWLMNGTRQVTGVSLFPDRVADTNWEIMATGDFNGDGRRDILWQHRIDGLISVWLMNGTTLMDGRLLTPDRVASPEWRIAGAGDFNGDGKSDIVWQNDVNGWLSVWYMDGTSMADGVWLNPADVGDTDWKIRAVGDINADGRPDLLWQHLGDGSVAAWFMNGVNQIGGTLLSPSAVPDLGWKIVGPK